VFVVEKKRICVAASSEARSALRVQVKMWVGPGVSPEMIGCDSDKAHTKRPRNLSDYARWRI